VVVLKWRSRGLWDSGAYRALPFWCIEEWCNWCGASSVVNALYPLINTNFW